MHRTSSENLPELRGRADDAKSIRSALDRREFLAVAGAAGLAAAAMPAASVFAQARTPATDLRGVVALITGCSTGFGNLAARSLAGGGATVVASMRASGGRNADRARELSRLETPGRIVVVDIDVDDDASVERGVERAREVVGEIDVFVNNAGIVSAGPIALSYDSVRREFETNVFGGLRMLRAVLPGMERAGSGLVVHISSGLGRFTLPTAGGYCGSKFAMEAIMEAAAYELHPLGIEVAIVQPGEFRTSFKANGRENAAEARAEWSDRERERSGRYREHFAVLDAAMQDRPTPPAQQVADAIVALVRAPRGERPLRVPIDPREAGQRGLESINGALEQAQLQLLQGNGLGHWASLRD